MVATGAARTRGDSDVVRYRLRPLSVRARDRGLVSPWLGQPFGLSPGSDVPLDFYESFQGAETVV